MEASEAKGKRRCGVQDLPNFELYFSLVPSPRLTHSPSTPKEPEPRADLGVPPRG